MPSQSHGLRAGGAFSGAGLGEASTELGVVAAFSAVASVLLADRGGASISEAISSSLASASDYSAKADTRALNDSKAASSKPLLLNVFSRFILFENSSSTT